MSSKIVNANFSNLFQIYQHLNALCNAIHAQWLPLARTATRQEDYVPNSTIPINTSLIALIQLCAWKKTSLSIFQVNIKTKLSNKIIYKITIILFFPNTVPINGTLRDCAKQKYETQNYKNGQWKAEVKVEEAYEEGCFQIDDKGQRSSTTQHCYCRGDLCNSSDAIQKPYSILVSVICYVMYYKNYFSIWVV